MIVLTCPSCGAPVDLARGDANERDGGGHPKDPALCSGCGEILVLNETLTAELASTGDLAKLRVAEPDLYRALLDGSAERKARSRRRPPREAGRQHGLRPGPQQDIA
jgi:hypothetical protein